MFQLDGNDTVLLGMCETVAILVFRVVFSGSVGEAFLGAPVTFLRKTSVTQMLDIFCESCR